MEKYKCYYTYTDDNGSCVVEGEYYKAADVAELAREDRTLISFLVSTIRCGESLSADDDEWISARMDKLKALAKEGG